MKRILSFAVSVYKNLFGLFPKSYRKKFGEDMLSDFAELAEDASSKGLASLLVFILREMRDYPFNLLRAHAEGNRMFKTFSSQPVSFGLRSAIGFGLSYFLSFYISDVVVWKLYSVDDSLVGGLQVFYFDLFHTKHGMDLISWIPNAVASLLTGLVLGFVFALFFADRAKFRRYVVAGMLCWFLHDALRSVMGISTSLPLFLGARHYRFFSWTEIALSGAFLGLMLVIAKSEKKEALRLLVVSSVAYPLISYSFVKLLFKFYIIETPWMFVALESFLVVFLASVFYIAIKGDYWRSSLIIIAGIALYMLSPYLARFIPMQ